MTRSVAYQWLVPWTEDGDLLHHGVEWRYRAEVTWREPEPFAATLTIRDGINAGRSAKYLTLISDDGRTFPMFVVDFLAMALAHGVPAGGRVTGWWVVRKRGQNFGVAYDGNGERPLHVKPYASPGSR